MSVTYSPQPARTDLVSRLLNPLPGRTGAGAPFRRHGLVLAAGSAAWAAAIALVGIDPHDRTGEIVFAIGSGFFQVGLLFLLRALWRSRALGEGRIARAVLRVEAVVLAGAMGSTLADGLGVTDLSQVHWGLLDACWPLSMLGMFLIGIRIAIAGRWTGLSRWWPMVAESWAVVNIPVMVLFGASVLTVTASVHLLVGYCVLGLLVSRKEA